MPSLARAHRSEEPTSELQSPRSTLFPYTTLFRSVASPCSSWSAMQDLARAHVLSLALPGRRCRVWPAPTDRKSPRLNSSHRDLHSFPTRRSSDLSLRPALPGRRCRTWPGLTSLAWLFLAGDAESGPRP